MRKIMAVILTIVLIAAASGCGKSAVNSPKEPDRDFNYKDAKWGMTLEEVLKTVGEPDMRTDEYEPEDESSYISFPLGNATDEEDYEYIDFYYNDKKIFDVYDCTERYLFDEEDKLWGVTAYVDVGEVSPDLMNLSEIETLSKDAYMSIREMISETYGEPNAEYTAYLEEGQYKVLEELDLDREAGYVCASRWDGSLLDENYRFIYVMYFINDLSVQVKYIPHDRETVETMNDAAA